MVIHKIARDKYKTYTVPVRKWKERKWARDKGGVHMKTNVLGGPALGYWGSLRLVPALALSTM